MQHPVLGVQLLVLGLEIVVDEVVAGAKWITVGLPLGFPGDLDHVSRPVRLNFVS